MTDKNLNKYANRLINAFLKNKIISQVELNIPTYTAENLPQHLLNLKAVKPGSRSL